MELPVFQMQDVIRAALREDLGYGDVTTDTLIPPEQESDAVFLVKQDGVLCGLEAAFLTLRMLDPDVRTQALFRDGDRVKRGDIAAKAHGKTRALLKAERTALNLLQHLSGVATATARAVEEVEGTGAFITDTRKTLPGLRALEKYAVATGGGRNHRYTLSDAAMVKDNHVDAVGSIGEAVKRLRQNLGHTVKVEVEARTIGEVREALDAHADIIMLDNMDVAQMRDAVALISHRAAVEASGGLEPGALRAVAETGVDVISLGALTHSVRALDISMKLRPAPEPENQEN